MPTPKNKCEHGIAWIGDTLQCKECAQKLPIRCLSCGQVTEARRAAFSEVIEIAEKINSETNCDSPYCEDITKLKQTLTDKLSEEGGIK